MNSFSYALSESIDAVVFDCDGTLSSIEGIEILAEQNSVGKRVHELTEIAMSHEGISSALYEERLALVRPSRADVIQLAQQYFISRTEDIVSVIEVLKALGKEIFVMSAGVNPAVQLFSAMLDIPAQHVYAVDLTFSADGAYESYDADAHVASNKGKKVLVDELKKQFPRIIHVGDGMNDVAVIDSVERFVGYGGAKYRQKISDLASFYITCSSMSPLLPLCLTVQEAAGLEGQLLKTYNKGLQEFHAGRVICHEGG